MLELCGICATNISVAQHGGFALKLWHGVPTPSNFCVNADMAESKFHIELNIKTTNDFTCYGTFILGNNRKFASGLFQKMKGSKKVDDKTILQLEFIETRNDLPVNIQVISCSLEQLAENCKTITKEIFKFSNLEKS